MKQRYIKLMESNTTALKPEAIDLSSISNIVNELNLMVAPSISTDLKKHQGVIKNKKDELKGVILNTKKINEDVLSLKKEQSILSKKLKIVALLSDLHSNFKVNTNVKMETLNLIRDLDEYSEKRLSLQIERLEKIINN